METEKIIRDEASDFYESKLVGSLHTEEKEKIRELKYRLMDFYTDDFKAIFLDEIMNKIKLALIDHRKRHHNGNADPACQVEKSAEKLLFYVMQELSILPTIAHKSIVKSPIFERKKVFISYSHLDKEILNDVQRHFKPFLSQIDFWDDTKILPGQRWKEEIRAMIDQTKVAILLVSTDFLGSEFIATNELPPLLKAAENDGAAILILIVKPCLFEEFPDLNQYQAMNPPNRPVSKMVEDEKEELLVNLVRQTKRILQ